MTTQTQTDPTSVYVENTFNANYWYANSPTNQPDHVNRLRGEWYDKQALAALTSLDDSAAAAAREKYHEVYRQWRQVSAGVHRSAAALYSSDVLAAARLGVDTDLDR